MRGGDFKALPMPMRMRGAILPDRTPLRDYMRRYMAKYRADGRDKGAKPRPTKRRYVAPAIFRPLPRREQLHGHCCFCGLQSPATVCGFCTQEIERVA